MLQTNWKYAASVALLSLCACAAFGQAPDGPPPGPPPDQQGQQQERGPNPERELAQLTRLLTLTADQQTGVKAILQQQAEQMKALRQKPQSDDPQSGPGTAMKARRQQAEAIRNESATKISALLDDSQKKTFADWQAKRQAAMERRRQNQGPDGGPPPDGGGPPPPPQD